MLYLRKFLKESLHQLANNRITYALFILLLLFFLTMDVWAGTIFEFHPFLTTEEKYDDNLYQTRSNKRSDWITTISPGITASLLNPLLNFELEYQPGLVYFLHNPQLDYTSHDVNFNSTFDLTPRLTFSLTETFLHSNEPSMDEMLETDYERSLRTRTRAEYDRNTIVPQLEYRFARDSFIRLYYRNTDFSSDDPDEDEYTENYFESELEYWFNVRNGINLSCNFTKGNFDIDTDLLNAVNITARYMRRFTPHFELYGEYGVGVTDFEETRFFMSLDRRREVQVGLEDVEDYDLRKFNVGFEWQLPQNFRIDGFVGYYWKDGVGNRDDQGLNASIEFEKTTQYLSFILGAEKGYSADFFAIDDAGFTEAWRLFTNLAYNYHEKLELSCGGSYGYEEYTYGREGTGFISEAREDYQYNFNTQLTYSILRNYFFLRELSLEMEFNHTEIDSSIDRDGYINNQYMLRLTATF